MRRELEKSDHVAVRGEENFTQHVNKPTHGDNLLDIIATDHSSLATSTSVIDTHLISDHSLVKCSLNIHKLPVPITHRTYRPLHHANFSQLDDSLFSSSLITHPAQSVDEYAEQIEIVVNEELDKVAEDHQTRSTLSTVRHV